MVWISVESVVISPLSFLLHLFGCSLFSFLSVWLVVCLFCWSFQKTSSWFIDFLKGFSCLNLLQFSSYLSYFLSSARFWVFFLSYSSSSFNFDDRVSILDLSILLIWALIAIYFPLETALNVSQRLWHVVSSFSLFQRTSLFLPSFHFLSSQHSKASCSVAMKLCSSELVSEFWVLTWLHYGLRDCLLLCQLFCICWGVLYFQLCN